LLLARGFELPVPRSRPRAFGRVRRARSQLHHGAVALPAAIAAALLLAAAPPASKETFAECDRAVAAAPARYESYLCYYRAGARASAFPEAAARLEGLQAEGRGGGW